MKLGKKMSDYYDHPSSKDAMIHPEVSLPSELFDKSYKVGEKCVLELTGTIESMGKKEYRIKLTDGIEKESASEEKKESKKQSLLNSAKVNT